MRRLQKCPACGEWFNTTNEVMMRHYMTKHKPHFDKAAESMRLAALASSRMAQAFAAPFPLNLHYCLEATMIRAQLELVQSATPQTP